MEDDNINEVLIDFLESNPELQKQFMEELASSPNRVKGDEILAFNLLRR